MKYLSISGRAEEMISSPIAELKLNFGRMINQALLGKLMQLGSVDSDVVAKGVSLSAAPHNRGTAGERLALSEVINRSGVAE